MEINDYKQTDYLDLLDNIPMVIAYVDRDLIYRYVNNSYEKFIGHSRQQLIGQSIVTFLGNENFARIKKYVDAALDGESVSFDLAISIEGQRHMKCYYIPRKDEQGRVLGVYLQAEDITREKQYEELFEYLWKTAMDPGIEYKEQIRRVLYAVRRYLKLPFGGLTKVSGSKCEVFIASSEYPELKEGVQLDRECSFCNLPYVKKSPVIILDGEQQCPKQYAVVPCKVYFGEPIAVAGEEFGVITFLSYESQSKGFSDKEKAIISVIRRWIGAVLTEQKEHELLVQSQKQLHALSKEYETILDSVPSYIWYKDTRNNILNANAQVLKSLHISRDQIKQKSAREFYGEMADKFFVDDLDVMKSREPKLDIIEKVPSQETEDSWVRTDKIPLQNESGDVDRIVVISTDISKEMNARRMLEDQRRFITTAYQETPALMYSVNEKGEIELVSDEWLTNFGYQREEVMGRRFTEFFTEESVFKARDYFNQLLELEGANSTIRLKDQSFQVITKQGYIRDVLLSACVERDLHNRFKRIRAVLVDVTEKNQLDLALKRSNKELEAFAYVASHDLKAPLRHISTFAEILAEEFSSKNPNPSEIEQSLKVILSGTEKMQDLIEDLLLFSRVNEKQIKIEQVNTRLLVNEVWELFEIDTREINAMIVCENLPIIGADRTKLFQLFQNLFSNAIKFRSPESDLQVTVSATELESKWQITVSDNGIGFEEKYANKIFEVFQRLHCDGSYTGTGIGLSICKKVVERHGGQISVHSAPGKGTTFVFTIDKNIEETKYAQDLVN